MFVTTDYCEKLDSGSKTSNHFSHVTVYTVTVPVTLTVRRLVDLVARISSTPELVSVLVTVPVIAAVILPTSTDAVVVGIGRPDAHGTDQKRGGQCQRGQSVSDEHLALPC